MFNILDRYILRGFVVNYLIALTVMMGLYVVIDLFFNLDEFTKDAQQTAFTTIGNILDYYGYQLLLYFAQLAGVITLVAACATLARMHRQNEFVAVLAAGTSLFRIARPIIFAGILMNLLWLVDQELLVPSVADKLARTHDDIDGKNVYPIWFLPDTGSRLLSARKFLPYNGVLRGLLVLHRDDQGRLTRIIRADEARWDPERRAWALTLGVSENPTASGVRGSEESRSNVDYYESALSPSDIQVQQASKWTSFLSMQQLMRMQNQVGADPDIVKVRHSRITTPLTNMVLLLLGLPFFLTRQRHSLVVSAGWCLLLCGACFVATFFGQNTDFAMLTNRPELPIWLPVITFGTIAAYLLPGLKT